MIRLCSLAVNGPRGRAWQKRVWRGFAGIQAGHGGRPARNSRWPQAVRAIIIICLVWLAQAAAPRCRGFAKAEAVESADALLAGAALEYVSTVDVSGIERFITDLDDDVAENMPELNIMDIMLNHGADVLDLPGFAGRA
ncbi:MAG: hypothetical protein GX460_02765, partial [Firmicutes bacterium]|nr:hypothetical protein [Bacillota bacterium]